MPVNSKKFDSGSLSLRCLGVPTLSHGGIQKSLTQQQARLLSVLVAAGPSGVDSDGILEALWGSNPPKARNQAVYTLVFRLDHGPDLLVNDAGRYRISNKVEVDAWRFDELVNRSDVDAQLEGIRLWSGRPFEGIEAGHLVESEASRLLRARNTATESIARRAPREQLREVEGQIREAADDDPYNEPLVIAAASALYRLNKRRDALSVLQLCRASLRRDLGLGGSAELDAAELALLNDQNPIPVPKLPDRSRKSRSESVPLALAPRASVFVGRSDELELLNQALWASVEPNGRGCVAVIQGDAGIGKSELVAQFANRNEGINVRVGTNSIGSSAAYAPWLRAIPEATHALAELSAASDPGSANLVFWTEVERAIQNLVEGTPLVVVLEDVHQSDPQSMLLFGWLASGSLPPGVLVLATTRPPEDGSPWADIVNDLSTRQDTGVATVIDVNPLSLASIQQMVAARFPNHSPAGTFRFASQVHALSQGNPLVGSALIQDSDAPTDLVTGTPRPIEEHHAQSVRSRVDGVVSGILTNAGLIGHEFDLEVLAALCEMTPSGTLVHLETAMAAGLVIEAEQLGRFRFDNVLTAEAFAQRASRVRRNQTCRSLIEFEDLPAADRVRYIWAAFKHAGSDEAPRAAELLWAEAQKLAKALSFVEARSACEYAVEILDSVGLQPDLELLVLRAEVTARAGDLNQMDHYRQAAFDLARESGSIDDMARAALVGLPATERYAGDPALLELLEQIDVKSIEDNTVRGMFIHQFVRAARPVHKAEQALEQTKWVTQADIGDDEMWAEFCNERLQIEHRHNPRVEVLDELDALAEGLPPSHARTQIKFRALLFSVIHQLDDSLTRRLDEAKAELLVHPVSRVQWACELTESALALVGMYSSNSNPESVLATGFRLGVADAFPSFGAQSWHGLWLDNRLDEALALLEGAKGLIEPNVGWRAAEAFNLAAVGRRDEGARLAREVGSDLRSTPGDPWALPAAALLVDACRFLDGSAQWARIAADILCPHSGTAVVLGTGVTHLGPADLYIGRALEIAGEDAAAGFTKRGKEQARSTGFVQWDGYR